MWSLSLLLEHSNIGEGVCRIWKWDRVCGSSPGGKEHLYEVRGALDQRWAPMEKKVVWVSYSESEETRRGKEMGRQEKWTLEIYWHLISWTWCSTIGMTWHVISQQNRFIPTYLDDKVITWKPNLSGSESSEEKFLSQYSSSVQLIQHWQNLQFSNTSACSSIFLHVQTAYWACANVHLEVMMKRN